MLILESLNKLHGANPYAGRSVLVGTLGHEPPGAGSGDWTIDGAAVRQAVQRLHDAGVTGALEEDRERWPCGAAAHAIVRMLMAWVELPEFDDLDLSHASDSTFVIPAEPERALRESAEIAVSVLAESGQAVVDGDTSVESRLDRFRELADDWQPTLQIAALADACRQRGIPWRLASNGPRYFLLGEGRHQCRLDLSVTSSTSRLAVEIARNKAATNSLLARFGMPVPRQILVMDGTQAWRAAGTLGLPVVVKPRNGNMGRGVSVNLDNEADVRKAVERAKPIHRQVIVETFLPGVDHRVLVAGGRVLSVYRRTAAHVVGDGKRTVRQLLDDVNADPRRSRNYRTLLKIIEYDTDSERLLAARGYSLDSVPGDGEVVFLKSAANWSAGGTTVDVTNDIHPDNKQMIVRAVGLVGLDIGGVDFIVPDIARSYKETGGGICEINYRPAILDHMAAERDEPRDIAGELIDAVYRPRRGGRLPTLVVYGTAGAGELARAVAGELRNRWRIQVGCHTGEGLFLDDWAVEDAPAEPHAAHALMTEDPLIEAAVLAVGPERLSQAGLGVPFADFVATPPGGDAFSGGLPRDLAERVFERAGAVLLDGAAPVAVAESLAGLLRDAPADVGTHAPVPSGNRPGIPCATEPGDSPEALARRLGAG